VSLCPTSARTKLSNCGESTVCSSERTTTMSVTVVAESGGKTRSWTSRARSDSGLFVGSPSVVRLPPSSVAIATIARRKAATQAPIVRHG
jgi:hypothetical protein